MSPNSLKQRQTRYFQLSSALAQLDNTHLQAVATTSERPVGWGANQSLTVADTPVFVKRVPITHLEYAHMFSTKNLYDLPTFYQYGFGSVGLSVFRELATHIKTTNWVLAGEIETFPLLYHYRIVPITGEPIVVDMDYHQRHVTYWGSNDKIGRYLLDRAEAPYELVLYLEHIPYTVATWVRTHQSHLPMVMSDAKAAITFLKKQGVLHLDSHFFNLLTDGQRAYLTDFGLALDKTFELSPAEAQFYQQHTEYDYGNLLWSLGTHVCGLYRDLLETDKQRIAKVYDLNEALAFEELMTFLLAHIDELAEQGLMKIDQNYMANIAKYLPVIRFMHDFYVAMRRNDQKDTPFEPAKLHKLLVETAFI